MQETSNLVIIVSPKKRRNKAFANKTKHELNERFEQQQGSVQYIHIAVRSAVCTEKMYHFRVCIYLS